jgi:predicted  nucleic acid-binding Zn-ribbon protein
MATLALQQQIDDAGGVRAELENELTRLRLSEEDVRKQILVAKRNLNATKAEFEDWETAALRQQIADAAGVRKVGAVQLVNAVDP